LRSPPLIPRLKKPPTQSRPLAVTSCHAVRLNSQPSTYRPAVLQLQASCTSNVQTHQFSRAKQEQRTQCMQIAHLCCSCKPLVCVCVLCAAISDDEKSVEWQTHWTAHVGKRRRESEYLCILPYDEVCLCICLSVKQQNMLKRQAVKHDSQCVSTKGRGCKPMMVSLQRFRPNAAMTLATLCFFCSVDISLGSRNMAAKYSVSHTVKDSYNKSSCNATPAHHAKFHQLICVYSSILSRLWHWQKGTKW